MVVRSHPGLPIKEEKMLNGKYIIILGKSESGSIYYLTWYTDTRKHGKILFSYEKMSSYTINKIDRGEFSYLVDLENGEKLLKHFYKYRGKNKTSTISNHKPRLSRATTWIKRNKHLLEVKKKLS